MYYYDNVDSFEFFFADGNFRENANKASITKVHKSGISDEIQKNFELVIYFTCLLVMK